MEGVDRNALDVVHVLRQLVSPSSWRAWIEIHTHHKGCDVKGSPSSWRAWIEILNGFIVYLHRLVALLMEGVDRNVSALG